MTDRTLGDTIYRRFTTRAFATGVPTTLAGTPVVSAYEDDSTTQITAGITLGVDHDSVSGLNLLTIVATGGNGFENGKDYDIVITTGTVGGTSVVGEVVFSFSLGLSAAVISLESGVDVTSWNGNALAGAGPYPELGVIESGAAQAATSTTIQLRAATAFADDEIIGSTIVIRGGSTGVGQSRIITDYVSSTDTATVDTWKTTPTGTITYVIFAKAPADQTNLPPVNTAKINDVTVIGAGTGGDLWRA